MVNPFDDDNQEFHVLINDEGQYSLWPTFKKIPEGWTAVGRPQARKDCVTYIQETWTDLRPKSLIKQMEQNLPA